MVELQIESEKGTKTYFAPALLKVAGVSQYNPDQLRFEELDDFWAFGDMAGRSTGGKVPPIGTVGWFTLSTNPKKGPNAKAGSLYRDVVAFKRASDEEKAGLVSQPSAGEQAAYVDHQNGTDTGLPVPLLGIDGRISLGMAFNNLTVRLAAIDQLALNFSLDRDGNPEITPFDKPDWYGIAEAQWWSWFDEASRGLPLSPRVEEPEETPAVVEDAAELDAEAEAHLGKPESDLVRAATAMGAKVIEPAPPAEEVTELPW